jgi:hypothetical protein
VSEPDEERRRVEELVARLIEQGVPAIQVTLDDIRQRVEQALAKDAEEGGVSPALAREHISVSLVHEGDGHLLIVPKNIFTMLVTLGIVRDPDILRTLTVHTEEPEDHGAWVDEFTDERGRFVVAFTLPDVFEAVVLLPHPAEHIQIDLNLPGEPE